MEYKGERLPTPRQIFACIQPKKIINYCRSIGFAVPSDFQMKTINGFSARRKKTWL